MHDQVLKHEDASWCVGKKMENKNLVIKVVNVKRQICNVLAVKKVVHSTFMVSIFLTNTLD